MIEKTTQPGFMKILAPVDGSENSYRAAGVAVALAWRYSAELIVLNVVTTPSYVVATEGLSPPYDQSRYFEYLKTQTDKFLDKAVQIADIEGV